MADLLRVGLIGFGKAGRRHADAIAMTDDALVVAAADPDPEAEAAAIERGFQHFKDYGQMLESSDIDAVVVSLPHNMLHEAGMRAASRGLHVLLEKPMAVSIPDARALIDECRNADLRLMVNFAHRFRTECWQAFATIQSGAIGQPVLAFDVMASGASDLPGWVWDRETAGGGMMMYNGIHSVDRLAWLLSARVSSVSAASGTFSYPVEVEDNLVGTLTFESGAIGAVLQHKSTAASTIKGWQTMVYGTRGALRITGENGLEITSEKESNELLVSRDNHFLGAFYEFADAIRNNRDPVPSGDDGIRALSTVLTLYKAADTRSVVTLSGSE